PETDPFRKASVFERVIEMEARIGAALIVANPVAVTVHVRRVGMTRVIREAVVGTRRAVKWWRTASRNEAAADASFVVATDALRRAGVAPTTGEGEYCECHTECVDSLHGCFTELV